MLCSSRVQQSRGDMLRFGLSEVLVDEQGLPPQPDRLIGAAGIGRGPRLMIKRFGLAVPVPVSAVEMQSQVEGAHRVVNTVKAMVRDADAVPRLGLTPQVACLLVQDQ